MLASGVTRAADHIVILITCSCDREMQLMKVSKFTVFQRHTTDQRQRSQDCPVQDLITFLQTGPQPQPGCQTWTPEWWPLTSEPVISCSHCIGDASVSPLDWDLRAVSMQRPTEGPSEPYWWKVGRWIGMVGRCKWLIKVTVLRLRSGGSNPVLPLWETNTLPVSCTWTRLDCWS